MEHLELFFKSVFVDNMVFAYFLGMCSYLAVSKKVSTAVGLGAAVIFVLTVTVPLNWFLDQYILREGALAWLGPEYADYDLSFLSFILFIATIATMVQLVEIVVEKFSPSLYNSLGIFLPLIAVNCAILGGSLFMQSRDIQSAGLALNYGFSSGIGWFLAILAIAAIREKIRYSNVPAPLRGLGITFIITGLMAIGFMGFGGMLTGGSDEKESEENTAVIETVETADKEIAGRSCTCHYCCLSGVNVGTCRASIIYKRKTFSIRSCKDHYQWRKRSRSSIWKYIIDYVG